MADTRLNYLASLLESKNRIVRKEAAVAFAKYSIGDERAVEVLLKCFSSPTWDCRITAGDALQALLSSMDPAKPSKEVKSETPSLLYSLDVYALLNNYAPLLSVEATAIGRVDVSTLSRKQQRQLIDQHLDLESITGLTSATFLEDSEVLPTEAASSGSSPRDDIGQALASTEAKFDEDSLKSDESAELHEQTHLLCALLRFVANLLAMLADHRWFVRHGAAIAIAKVLICQFKSLPKVALETTVLRLLQVLALDQFNDFVSGRAATAPVRESCAIALGHLLYQVDADTQAIVSRHMETLILVNDDKFWHCRQSGILVLKYYFSVAKYSSLFDSSFQLVMRSLNDSVDDVVSCAVSALASLLCNDSLGDQQKQYIVLVMTQVWTLLEVESKKEQLLSGLDGLAIDLMNIVLKWMQSDETVRLKRNEMMLLTSMLDAAYQSRTQLIIKLLEFAILRDVEAQLKETDVYVVLKGFLRVLLFSAPTQDTRLVEHVFTTSTSLLIRYREAILSGTLISSSIGKWIGTLLFDHRNPVIDVYHYDVDGASSSENSPSERMCSEEMRFYEDREKDDMYITRKIITGKFLAVIIQLLYESGKEVSGQKLSTALQLLFVPFIRASSLYQTLGAAIIINEWAATYKMSHGRGVQLEPPMVVIQEVDAFLRVPSKSFDELSQNLTQLTKDCSEFVDYCAARGLDRSKIDFSSENVSIEEISKKSYEMCRPLLKNEKHLEALDSRYEMLCKYMHFAKQTVRSNTVRVYAFLSSSMYYFGCAPEKLTPMVRPLVDCMQTEENETVASEVFKGSIPLLVAFSWQRNPRPYVKVLAKAVEAFYSCSNRIPRRADQTEMNAVLSQKFEEAQQLKPSAPSRNAELMFLVCSSLSLEHIPEFYALFGLDDCEDEQTFVARLEMHGCLWSRVGSQLSNSSTTRILTLLKDENPAMRYAASKAIATFARSQLGDTLSRCFGTLRSMLQNISNDYERLGAVEAFYRLSLLGAHLLGVVGVIAPVVFRCLSDKNDAVRNTAGEAFRNLLGMLAVEDVRTRVTGLSEELDQMRRVQSDFIIVLSQPSELPLLQSSSIIGLSKNVELRYYQKEGVTWMMFLRKFGLNGILADDMGLGKTLQTLCVLSIAMEEGRSSLIVCPRTLVNHWCNEWKRFFPSRRPARTSEGIGRNQKQAELVVVAYEELKNNPLLRKLAWEYVVLDEGHCMRNPKTAIWRAANELTCVSRLILSGTPVQNSAADLWGLFAWLIPGYLGEEKQFRAQFLRKILKSRTPKATDKDVQDGSAAIARLHRLILPFVLRRLKGEVLKELPDKLVQDYECELSDGQRKLYEFVASRCTSRKCEEDGGISPLHALITLRKLVDHATLISDVLHKLRAPSDIMALSSCESGKLSALGQLLNECGIGEDRDEQAARDEEESLLDVAPEMPHRALIFCQWKCSLQLVSNALASGAFGRRVQHLILDGSVPPSERQTVVDRFNSDHSIDVLLLTTHIGGVGLNLTGADVVIFLDHDWNPMRDLQAIDRAHRLGQTRKVNVYRLITKGTIEQKVMNYQQFKLNTADALIGTDNRSMNSMQTDELMSLFTLDSGGGGAGGDTMQQPATKRKKKADATSSEQEQWNLTELWDESQYEEQFDVKSFRKDIK